MEMTSTTSAGSNDRVKRDPELAAYPREGARRYDSTLNHFISQCGKLVVEPLATETFVDDEGVPRYIENWQQVDNSTLASFKHELSSTGCVDILFKLATHDSTHRSEKYTVSFLLDFQKLWCYFENDSVDEIAEYSPLFRVYIETCFHQRTIQFMTFITLYYFAVTVGADQYFQAIPIFSRIMYYVYVLIQSVVYLALAVVFKGSVFGRTAHTSCKPEDKEKTIPMKRNMKKNQIGRWMYFAQEAFRTTALEMQRMYEHHSTASTVPINHATPFYDALNVAAKFLSRSHIRGTDRIRLNSPVHNAKLFFIFFAVPLYCTMSTYFSLTGPYPLYVLICDEAGSDSTVCANFRWVFILTLGYTLAVVQTTIFMSSVLLALVGLGFGAEMGRALVDSWITRFGPLRRLDSAKPADVVNPVAAQPSEQNEERNKRLSRVPLTPNPVVNELHRQLEKHMQLVEQSANDVEADFSVSPQEALPYLPRDAYEHYLFLREFMTTGSRAWSPTIVALSFLCAFFVGLFVFVALMIGAQLDAFNWVYYACWIAVRVYLLTIHPVMSLAHANAYVYALQEQFLVAAPEDFAVLGGRDAWMDYLVKVPAIWTVYGFEISWDRLSGALWTVVAALGALALSYASSAGL